MNKAFRILAKKMPSLKSAYIWFCGRLEAVKNLVLLLKCVPVVRHKYANVLDTIRKRSKVQPLRVVFLVNEISKWKGQSLFDEMKFDCQFKPIIAIFPSADRVKHIPNVQQKAIEELVTFFHAKEMPVRNIWSVEDDKPFSFTELEADIVIYQQPWGIPHDLMPDQIARYSLTFYYPYYMPNHFDLSMDIGLPFHRLLYGYIVSNKKMASYYKSHALKCTCACHFFPWGHPMQDNFRLHEVTDAEYVIYAPHWTFAYGKQQPKLLYSTFLKNGKEIQSYAKQHPEIKWVWKPHPGLRQCLVESGVWTEKEVTQYYSDWEKIAVSCYTSDYADLFMRSRVLITDCASFLTEYACTGNPVIRLVSSALKLPNNPIYGKLYSTYYCVHNMDELYATLDEVVVARKDVNREARLLQTVEAGLNAKNASTCIVENLKKLLGR